ncbi:alpha,alpha-phosphotrehalase [Clostridium paraputrificum]|uniref:Alpha,alpha-phosphotrehalase n=1 Tax=Clostridium paraputrificum TaxID=29363 RepID=A0A6N3G0L6_9CLOT
MKDFRTSCVYQIYPKSFKDSNGDGIGDLRGIIEKLDYLKFLGIDYIWLTPFYVSPQNDNGYDVADYKAIDSRFGTMEDLEELIEKAKAKDINIMLDLVFNHTSTEHIWFKKAIDGDKKYKDYYIFKKGREKGIPPTNWESKFGGSAWEYVEKFDEYYLHLFDKTQADLNWDNQEVRNEIIDIIKFWMSKGIKGFRLDVINLISKPRVFEDDNLGDGRRFYTDGENIHKYLKEVSENTFSLDEEIITVGEMSSTTIDHCIKYSNPKEKELSMVFNFHHLKADYADGDKWSLKDLDFMELKDILNKWQIGMEKGNGWNAVFWCNHDQPRVVSRYGNDSEYHKESAKMLATTIHLMRGTPYIYQGEEFGMINAYFNDIDKYRDVESINYYNILKDRGLSKDEVMNIIKARSRDNGRTPIQWDSTDNAGFTTGTPWIPLSNKYKDINVEKDIKDPNSILYHYKKLIELRKRYKVISHGSYEPLLEDNTKVFAYKRVLDNEELLVICNFYSSFERIILEEKNNNFNCILSNYKNVDFSNKIELKPYESLVFYSNKNI